MEKRIALEKRGRPDNQITELILDNCRSTNIDGLTDSFTALEILSLNNVGLVSLKNFPKLPSLRKLELSDNRISNGLSNLVNSQKLTHINLSGNKIKDYEELQPLKELEKLTVLDLFNNEVTNTEDFRGKMFGLIPSLKYLDGFDQENDEAPSEEDEINGNVEEGGCEEAFSINGIEIDFKELEELEKRVKQKQAQRLKESNQGNKSDELVDNLESNLNGLKIDEIDSEADRDLIEMRDAIIEQQNHPTEPPPAQTTSFAAFLVAFMGILALINQIVFKLNQIQNQSQQNDLEDEESESSDYDDDEFGNDVSLAEVYNEDLEEDNSDWNVEGAEEEDDDNIDEPSSDEEVVAKVEGKVEETDDPEEGARGKKRKHDG